MNLNFKTDPQFSYEKTFTYAWNTLGTWNLPFKPEIFMKSKFTSGTSDEMLASGLIAC